MYMYSPVLYQVVLQYVRAILVLHMCTYAVLHWCTCTVLQYQVLQYIPAILVSYYTDVPSTLQVRGDVHVQVVPDIITSTDAGTATTHGNRQGDATNTAVFEQY